MKSNQGTRRGARARRGIVYNEQTTPRCLVDSAIAAVRCTVRQNEREVDTYIQII